MAESPGLHPLLHTAMRTGQLPSDAEIVAATGRTAEEVARTLRPTTDSTEPDDEPPAPPDPDEQRFRDMFGELVADMLDTWWDDHPGAYELPSDERARIEEHCRNQIQHQWYLHRLSQANPLDSEDVIGG